MPIVDDPFDFGRIAATNALSDVYAMGGTPILALAIVAMPVAVLPMEVIREILRGGESVCAAAGIIVAGGHSIDSVEPIYGLAALGIVHPRLLKRNSEARPGDALVLGKPLGVGILSTALKRGGLDPGGYRTLLEVTTQLNRAGAELGGVGGVHAMTDVTGFGLLGHLLGMCRGAGLAAQITMGSIPLLDGVLELAAEGVVTGASARNWGAYGGAVRLAPELMPAHKALLCDPQTSGGLLVSCDPRSLPEVLSAFGRHGGAQAVRIGTLLPGEPGVSVTP
jgi:selenide, water dikinase